MDTRSNMNDEEWIKSHVWNLMTLKRKKYLVLIVVCLAVGFVVGFQFGVYKTLNEVLEIALRFVDIDIDLMKDAIWRYRANIQGCFPIKNMTNGI